MNGRVPRAAATAVLLAAACHPSSSGGREPAAGHGTVAIKGGVYTIGSGADERAAGYALSPEIVRRQRWYDAWEAAPREVTLEPFAIDSTPVTHAAYARFVAATGATPPGIDSLGYLRQGFLVHLWPAVGPYLWLNGRPPEDRLGHPVVLVDRAAAEQYCRWRGERTGRTVRLPSEAEWEASCRGFEGRVYPWGARWIADASHVDTLGTGRVASHALDRTPTGVRDLGGNVFEWTSAEMPDGRAMLKGCSWDDAPGTCRCGFRHGRPAVSRHILIGFRCVDEGPAR